MQADTDKLDIDVSLHLSPSVCLSSSLQLSLNQSHTLYVFLYVCFSLFVYLTLYLCACSFLFLVLSVFRYHINTHGLSSARLSVFLSVTRRSIGRSQGSRTVLHSRVLSPPSSKFLSLPLLPSLGKSVTN